MRSGSGTRPGAALREGEDKEDASCLAGGREARVRAPNTWSDAYGRTSRWGIEGSRCVGSLGRDSPQFGAFAEGSARWMSAGAPRQPRGVKCTSRVLAPWAYPAFVLRRNALL